MVPSSVLYCYREWGVDEALVTDEGVVPSQPKSALTQTSGVLDRTSGGIDGVSSLKDLRSFFENFEGFGFQSLREVNTPLLPLLDA